MSINNAFELYDTLNVISEQTGQSISYLWRIGGFVLSDSNIEHILLEPCNMFICNIIENIIPFKGLLWFFDNDKKYMCIDLDKNHMFHIIYEIMPNDIENLLHSFNHRSNISLLDQSNKNVLKKSIYDAYQNSLNAIDVIINEYTKAMPELLASFGFIIEESEEKYGKKLLLKC